MELCDGQKVELLQEVLITLVKPLRCQQSEVSEGGLIREAEGNWVAGFMLNIKIMSSFKTDIWGLREGVLGFLLKDKASLMLKMKWFHLWLCYVLNKPLEQRAAGELITADCQAITQTGLKET
nr:reverse transcriptase [Ipomoea batatas]GME03728.1 reverse transcriptase [Ipomoea batatas]GME05040.1 reverse transcriptase [Ipomoea batatas]